jgi:hypothetical protein
MSSPEPRRPNRLSRSQRVDRGANLVMASMASAAVFVVSLVLWIAGVIGGTLPLLSLILGAALGYTAYRSVKRR